MASFKVGDVDTLISYATEKTSSDRSTKGLAKAATTIGIAEDYFSKRIIPKMKGRDGNELISLRESILDKIARYLSYEDFKSFARRITNPPDSLLLSCVGTYYSYVRENAKTGTVLRSPVRVLLSDRGLQMELVGPSSRFIGTVTKQDGCLFVLLESATGKRFYHVYRIGNREQPNVLQGVFAGVTTNFEPIGGRAVLVRMDEEFSRMKGLRQTIAQLKTSRDPVDKALMAYFKEYNNNNVAPAKSYTFGIGDLG